MKYPHTGGKDLEIDALKAPAAWGLLHSSLHKKQMVRFKAVQMGRWNIQRKGRGSSAHRQHVKYNLRAHPPHPPHPSYVQPPHVTIPSNCSIWLCHLTVTRCHFPCGLESTTSKSTTMYPPQTTLKPLLPTSLLITKIFFLHASYCHGVTVRFHILAVQ